MPCGSPGRGRDAAYPAPRPRLAGSWLALAPKSRRGMESIRTILVGRSWMPSPKSLLALREGKRLDVYRDSRKKLTVGIGHLIVPADKLKLGDSGESIRMRPTR